jgi:hypothetical protein
MLPPPGILEGRKFYYKYVSKESKVSLGELGVPIREGKVKRRNDGS